MDLHIEQDTYGRWSVLDVAGGLDAASAPALRYRLNDALVTLPRVALRLDRAELSDSAHLSVIADACDLAARQGAAFALVVADQAVAARVTALTAPVRLYRSLYDLYGPPATGESVNPRTWGSEA
jgi:anti-anti-sigma factor